MDNVVISALNNLPGFPPAQTFKLGDWLVQIATRPAVPTAADLPLTNNGEGESANHIEIFDDVFGCMVFTTGLLSGYEGGSSFALFVDAMASKLGKKKLFDEVMLVSLLGKKLEEAGESPWATDSLYEGLRPFRLNPSDPNVQQAMRSLTKPERIAIERRAERIRALGIDKFADFDE